MNKAKIFYIALSLFLGSCFGSLAQAEDEYIPLWSFSIPNSHIDQVNYVPELRFKSNGQPVAESGLVIVGVTEGDNSIGQVQTPKVYAIGLNAETGVELWRNAFDLTDGLGKGGEVLSITPTLLRNEAGLQRATFVYVDKLRPGVAQIKLLDLDSGSTIESLIEEDVKREYTTPALYFKPIDGDFDGDGKIDDYIIRRDRSLIQAID